MLKVYPDYYKRFKCIADKCRHNCCIGWEIDIDPDTYSFYKTVKGEMGERLKNNISKDTEPHFILGENERCPFLNKNNLCDIIIGLGKEHICDICKEHPRFHNVLFDRIESGLGLSCEEAARLILSEKESVKLISEGEEAEPDEIIDLRDSIISVLQNREKVIEERIKEMLSIFNISAPDFNTVYWVEFLLKLERLDEKWTEVLNHLKNADNIDYEGFNQYIENRKYEYEQLAVYLVYRHMLNCFDMEEAAETALFTAFSFSLIYQIGAVFYNKTGDFSFEKQIEIARLFSSEIEYSDENSEKLKGALAKELK